jgi:hypothetical protein
MFAGLAELCETLMGTLMNKGLRSLGPASLLWLLVVAVAAADDCSHPGNLTHNCNFSNFVERNDGGGVKIVPDGWWPWVLMGSPAFDIDDHGSAPGAPAQRIWSDGGTWTAGLYQQVQVTPGKWYVARLDWAAPNSPDIERRVGIDPTGGTDPSAPHVVWGPSSWEVVRMPDLHAEAFSPGGTVTVFVWTHHPTSHGADQVFLDAATLVQDPNRAPPEPTPTPTRPQPTARPATQTPSPVQPIDTATALPASATPTDMATPTATPTLAPSLTPTSTPTLTPSLTPTPAPPTLTPLPSRTPLPTIVLETIAQAAGTPVAEAEVDSSDPGPSGTGQEGNTGRWLLLVGLVGAVLAGVALVGGAIWMRRRISGPSEAPGQKSEEA